MSSLGAPRRPSDPAGGGDNNRADTWTQSACERNLEWVRKRVNGRREPPLRRARASSPSARPSQTASSTRGRAAAQSVIRSQVRTRRNVYTDSPPLDRAVPPVGRT